MDVFTVLSWLAIGLIVGVCSKLLFPGRGAGSWIGTLLTCMTGAVADGWSGLNLYREGQGDGLLNWIAPTIGAVLTLVVYRFVIRRNLML